MLLNLLCLTKYLELIPSFVFYSITLTAFYGMMTQGVYSEFMILMWGAGGGGKCSCGALSKNCSIYSRF